MRSVVIVGAGQAGLQTAASLRQHGYEGRIALVGEEAEPPYQRPPLSKAYLKGAMAREGLSLKPEAFYGDQRVERIVDTAVAIDPAARRVRLVSGGSLAYDHLVLATGVRNRRLDVAGADLDGVAMLRTLDDADRLRKLLAGARTAVVVGAGFIGLEFAAVAAEAGVAVTVVERLDRPMARAVVGPVAAAFRTAHEGRGTQVRFLSGLVCILGEKGRVCAVELVGGERIAAELVLVGIGVLPADELAAQAGLNVDDGVVVDERLLTGDPAISAVGDVARFPTPFAPTPVRLESVQNAIDQARFVATRLMGGEGSYRAVPWFWSDQGADKLQIAGLTRPAEHFVTRGDPAGGRFSVFCYRQGRFVGAESVNRPAEHMAARRILAAGRELDARDAADASFDLKAFSAAPPAVRERTASGA